MIEQILDFVGLKATFYIYRRIRETNKGEVVEMKGEITNLTPTSLEIKKGKSRNWVSLEPNLVFEKIENRLVGRCTEEIDGRMVCRQLVNITV